MDFLCVVLVFWIEDMDGGFEWFWVEVVVVE